MLLLLWPVTPTPTALPPQLAPTPPAWGGFWDLLLEGPDAGEWAINAARVAAGQLRQVDHHRLPTWLLMTGGLHRAGIDLVTAGHLVNRGLYVVMALCTWLAGRLLLGPGTALLAATLVLGSPHLRLASERYGIDIGVGAAVALIAASALAAGRWPRAAPILGIALCAAVLTHYTTLPLWLPALLLAAAAARPGQRWRALWGLSISFLVCGLLAHHFLRLPTGHELLEVVLDGLPGATSGAARPEQALAIIADRALPRLWVGLQDGPALLLNAARPCHAPWGLVLLAGGLGLLGSGIPTLLRPGTTSRWAALSSLPVGLAIASLAGSAPLLSAVQAPERYLDNFAPVSALLLATGIGTLSLVIGTLGEALRSPRNPRLRPCRPLKRTPLPRALNQITEASLPFAVVALVLPCLARPTPMPDHTAVGLYLAGDAIRRQVPDGIFLASPASELAVATGHPWCSWPLCSAEAPGADPEACLGRIRQVCGHGQALGWITLPGWKLAGGQDVEQRAMDQWIARDQPALQTIEWGTFHAQIRLLPANQPAAGGATR